jgi:quinol monooxygenase YgiN
MFMMTIRVNIYPEKQQEFMQTILSLLAEIRKTTVCLDYVLYRAVEEDNSFCLVSKWQSQQQLYEHVRTRAFSVLFGAMQVLGNTQDIKLDTISQTRGVEALEAIRSHSKRTMQNQVIRG